MENNYDLNVPKVDLPNATLILVLGIISIIGCCCYGIVGIICAIIVFVLAKSANAMYLAEPGKYTEGSYKNINTGKICAWIGVILSALYLLFMLWLIAVIGIAGLTDPTAIQEYFQGLG